MALFHGAVTRFEFQLLPIFCVSLIFSPDDETGHKISANPDISVLQLGQQDVWREIRITIKYLQETLCEWVTRVDR